MMHLTTKPVNFQFRVAPGHSLPHSPPLSPAQNQLITMYSTNPHQELLQAIANLTDQQIPLVLQFISSLETPVNNYPTSAKTVLEKMGGYPKFLLEGSGDFSDRDVRKKALAERIQARHQTRNHE